MTDLETQLALFEEISQRTPSPTPLPPWTWSYKGGTSGFHIGASVMIHGDEVGPLAGLLDVMEALEQGKLPFVGQFSCFIGHPEAGRENVRFLEKDLNRVMTLCDTPSAQEEHRAQELLPLLDRVDLYIDFHQTILDVRHPFYICPWQEEGWHWMRLMGGASAWVTRHPNRGGGGLLCADEYVRQRGRPSVALELGRLGFTPESRSGVWRSLSRAFDAVNRIAQEGASLSEIAAERADLSFYETAHRASFDDPKMALDVGLKNFTPIQAGQRLSREGADIEVLAPMDGVILFPKYPLRDAEGAALEPRPKELYRVIRALKEHPLTLWSSP